MDWGSIGAPLGSFIHNSSTLTAQDIHIHLKNGQTFDPTSTGGAAFPGTKISPDGTTIDFTGGSFPPCTEFWMQVPEAPQPTDPPTIFEGYMTPLQGVWSAPPTKKFPSLRHDGIIFRDTMVAFDHTTATLTLQLGTVQALHYQDGSILTTPDSSDILLGSQASVTPTSLRARVRSGFQFDDMFLTFRGTSGVLIVASPCEVAVFGDESLPNSDSLLQATFAIEQGRGLQSRFLGERYNRKVLGSQIVLEVRSSLLGSTSEFSRSAALPASASIVDGIYTAPTMDSISQLPARNVAVVLNSSNERSDFSADRFAGTLLRSGIPAPHVEALVTATQNMLALSPDTPVTTDQLRRIGDLARANPFVDQVAGILRNRSTLS
jgi:hypothetical protein